MQTWFYYLVKEKGVATNDILDYYVEERGMSPQQYWFELFGAENLRTWFADWVAHTAADQDYLTREEHKSHLITTTRPSPGIGSVCQTLVSVSLTPMSGKGGMRAPMD